MNSKNAGKAICVVLIFILAYFADTVFGLKLYSAAVLASLFILFFA